MHSYWRSADQLLNLYISRLLSSKLVLLSFKRRLKEQKPHPKDHSENTAKLTPTLFLSLLWGVFSTNTPCMVIPHKNLKPSQYFGPFKGFFSWQDSKVMDLSSDVCDSSCTFCIHVKNRIIIAHPYYQTQLILVSEEFSQYLDNCMYW